MKRAPLRFRTGQGLSVNIIILIAMGLLILVIAVLLVNRSGRQLSDSATTSCVSKGGTCKASCDTVGGREINVPEANADCMRAQTGMNMCCRFNFGGEDSTATGGGWLW